MQAQMMMPPKSDLALNIDYKSRDNLVGHLLERIEAEKGKLAVSAPLRPSPASPSTLLG